MITLADAILDINPNAIFSASQDINFAHKVIWREGTEAIDVDVLTTKYNELVAAYDAKAYARNRAAEYPSIADQLDDIYHNGIDAWKATIKATKDKYPKG